MYANICFIIAIILFVLDGMGTFPQAHLMSWGSAAFTAGFIAWEVIAEKEKHEEHQRIEQEIKNAAALQSGQHAAGKPERVDGAQ
jgi:hypothetical protein